jgi:pimeloyl-ACP methyl ester carboxylesterase
MASPERIHESYESHLWEARAERRSVISHDRDRIQISYQVLGKGNGTMVLASGLGGRLYIWEPLLERFSDHWRMITWDYRGLFESDAPSRIHRLAVNNHAEDLLQILDKEQVERAVFVGWSMGVQVSLEFASIYPERVDKLILLNGTHGHALTTGFQPLFRFPWLQKIFHELIDGLRGRKGLQHVLAAICTSPLNLDLIGGGYSLLRRQKRIKALYRQYMEDVFATDFGNYLRLFQELDAHSVYHHLRSICHPALIISGGLDYLTPAYQSREMLRKMPHSEHMHLALGTHFVLAEYPDKVVKRIARFLE